MFANPYMLLGLGLAVLPIIVHLLSRARYKTVDWGAMMFLEGADAAQSQSRRPRQFLLLLVRVLIIALLAIALARPEVRGKFAPSGAGARGNPTNRGVAAVLLDCSASMAFDENGHTRMELAKDAAQQLLSLHRGDRVSLVLMGQPQTRAERAPTADLWQVGRRIESAEVGYARADVSHSLEDALDALEPRDPAAPGNQFVTFYVVTDRQASNWREILDAGDDWGTQWRQRVARAGAMGRVVIIPVGSPEAENVVVRSIEVVSGTPVIGQPIELDVKVQNVGPVQWASLPLTVTADRRIVYDQRINLTPDSIATFRVPIATGFPDAGTHLVTAELGRAGSAPTGGTAAAPAPPTAAKPKSGGLAGDDRLEVVLDVLEPTRVLLISSSDPSTPASNALADDTSRPGGSARYIATALTPFKSARRARPDSCVVDLATIDQWAGPTVQLVPPRSGGKKPDPATPQEQRLSAYQVVVLTDVEQLNDAQVAALEGFVADGGGLLIVPGEQTRTEELNAALFKDGAGLLPAALGAATSSDWTDQTTLSGFDATHPILRFLGGKADALLPATIGRYFAVDRFATGARSLVRYATGEPLLIESPPAGGRRGKVLLLTTSPDADWSTLHREAAFVPLMQSAALYLREGTPRKLNLLPGEPIELPLDESAEGRMIRIRVPDSTDERQLELSRSGTQWVAKFGDTETPGLYLVRLADFRRTQVVQVMVTPSREESNLAALSAADWKRLERIVDAQRLDPATTGISAATALPAPLELWPVALGLVFLLGILEMKMARAMARTEKNE